MPESDVLTSVQEMYYFLKSSALCICGVEGGGVVFPCGGTCHLLPLPWGLDSFSLRSALCNPELECEKQ